MEKMSKSMTPEHREALDRSLHVLSLDLNVTSAIKHMKSKQFLEDSDEKIIIEKGEKKKQVKEFLEIIKTCGDLAYMEFKNYLQNSKRSIHLAQELEQNVTIVQHERWGQEVGKWKKFEEKFLFNKCMHDSIDQYKYIPEEVNILLIGKTGSGKSATGNTIIGEEYFRASWSSDSVTKTIVLKLFQESGVQITVIDTPGLFDTAKDFRNEEMVLEIAKTMISCKRGIHLFLFVCNSVRFTEEEQETVAVIEKILSKNIYKNCVVVLTSARNRYGAGSQSSLREHITYELQKGGNFAGLINRVCNRVVAVENLFEDDFLKDKQRQTLLCYLAQVIQENSGHVFSSKAFEHAKRMVEKEEEQRQQRIHRQEELNRMRKQVRTFLQQQYLNDMTFDELDNIVGRLKADIKNIMKRSLINDLDFVTEIDVQQYLEHFIQENEPLIAKLKDVKLQEQKQQEEYQKKQQQLEEETNLNNMKLIVLESVSGYLKQLSRYELEKVKQERALRGDFLGEIDKKLKSSHIKLESKHVSHFIEETYFKNPTEIEKIINDKIESEKLEKQRKELQRAQMINTVMEKLTEKLKKALPSKMDEEILDLLTDLKNVERHGIDKWEQLVCQLIRDIIANTEINVEEIVHLYLKQNVNFLEITLSTILEKRQKQREAEEKQKRDNLRLSAYSKISAVIKEQLKSYLREKSLTELNQVDELISTKVVPSDIFRKVRKQLTSDQQESLSNSEIQEEILKQIESQRKTIEDCKKEAECFAGASKVIIKGRGISKISSVKVDDEILVFDKRGVCFFDKIYLISHARDEGNITFICLNTSSGKKLFISPGHLLPVGDLCTNVAAKDVAIGNNIFSSQNGMMMPDSVTSISYELCRGAYCPMTMNGTIIVDDIAASCYTSFFPYRVAHVLLLPIRFLFRYLPLHFFDKLLPYDDAEGMPVLLKNCRSVVILWRSLVGTSNV